MAGKSDRHRHIVLEGSGEAEGFTSPRGGRGSSDIPVVNRRLHANGLLAQLQDVKDAAQTLIARRAEHEIEAQEGLILEVEAQPGFELAMKSLDAQDQGVELLSVKQGAVMLATIFVPHGKLRWLEKRITAFRDRTTAKGKPRNEKLVACIAAIRTAALRTLWTDDEKLFPEDGKPIWWEVWLRAGTERGAILDSFVLHAEQLGLRTKPEQVVEFIDRTVLLAWGTLEMMRESVQLLDCIAELRKAKELLGEFFDVPQRFQRELAEDLRRRTVVTRSEPAAVCLLDSGLNDHPLLEGFIKLRDTALAPSLGIHDADGHGTEMAGITVYGDDLHTHLLGTHLVEVGNVVESVKIWGDETRTEPELYGHVTAQGIYTAESSAPQRNRAFCLAITTRDFRDRGVPSSWSARLDAAISGDLDDDKQVRLVVVSAGNVEETMWRQGPYPDVNLADAIHDPGQAWNAITVGGFTSKEHLDPVRFPEWTPVAPRGRLSPTSTTSVTWADAWPIKPDVVFEAGNVAIDPATGKADTVDDVRLLTTNRDPIQAWFTTTGDTSAAAAQGARMAALISSEYPELWPETIRALVAHSAEWTDEMLEEHAKDKRNRIRCYGHGVPNLERALWSARDHLTLIVQDELTPFCEGGSEAKSNEMHIHHLPWPTDILQALGETPVEMRVTLSYFIEPNPARRGWKSRFVYPSHQLRFDVRRPNENTKTFRERVNKQAREEGENLEGKRPKKEKDSAWDLGTNLRHKGSLHQDTWCGVAADLAARGVLAVYPATGWWKTRPALKRWDSTARYALVVSIRAPKIPTDVDVYAAVAAQVTVETVTST